LTSYSTLQHLPNTSRNVESLSLAVLVPGCFARSPLQFLSLHLLHLLHLVASAAPGLKRPTHCKQSGPGNTTMDDTTSIKPGLLQPATCISGVGRR
jgi:hypothetical protein